MKQGEVCALMLNDKQERFCREYIVDLNATQAAIRAGYSEKTAYSQGERLLKDVEIQNCISELKAKREKKTEKDSVDVVNEIFKIGFSNIQDYFSSDFQIRDIVSLERSKAAAIQSVEVTETIKGAPGSEYTEKRVRIKLHDKNKALELGGKHLGIFEKDNEQRKPLIIPDIPEDMRRKFDNDFDRNH